jgi:(2Fe-2S) ferredoxin
VYRRDASRALEEGWYAGVDIAAALAVARAVHERAALPEAGRYDQAGAERSRAGAPYGSGEQRAERR